MKRSAAERRDRVLRAYLVERDWDEDQEFELVRHLVRNSKALLPEFPLLVGLEWETDGASSDRGDLLFLGEAGFAAVEVKVVEGKGANKARQVVEAQARKFAAAARVLHGACLPLVYTTDERLASAPPRHPAARPSKGAAVQPEEVRDRAAMGMLADLGDIELVTGGSGPIDEAEFDELLTALELPFFDLGTRVADTDDVWVVVGTELSAQEAARLAKTLESNPDLVVLSQEDFLAQLQQAGGDEPRKRRRSTKRSTLSAVTELAIHATIQVPASSTEVEVEPTLEPDPRPWVDCPVCGVQVVHLKRHLRKKHPTEPTAAKPGSELDWSWPEQPGAEAGAGPFGDGAWPRIGMLKAMGYTVAAGGDPGARREALQLTFDGPLRRVGDPDYVREWGADRSSNRLKKMAQTIASLANNLHRRAGWTDAVEAWADDLEWLRDVYWERRYTFEWPELQGQRPKTKPATAPVIRRRKR